MDSVTQAVLGAGIQGALLGRAQGRRALDSGFDALTYGNIAKRMNTKAANINYYFPQKEALIAELLNGIISNYEHEIDHFTTDESLDDEQRFKAIAQMIILDLATRETTRVFPELWARSNHDPFVQERLDDLYRRGRQAVVHLVGQLRPDIPREQREMIGVICAACFEGLTIFAGHGKAWESKIETIAKLAKSILLEGIMHVAPVGGRAETPISKKAPAVKKAKRRKLDD